MVNISILNTVQALNRICDDNDYRNNYGKFINPKKEYVMCRSRELGNFLLVFAAWLLLFAHSRKELQK